MAAGHDRVSDMIDEWMALRLEMKRSERAEHPPVTDVLGREWTWVDRDLYRHDGMAWPLSFITADSKSWPSPALLDNPNYGWCEHCRTAMEAIRDGRTP